MKIRKILMIMFLILFLTGCDGNKNDNVKIKSKKYIDTSDAIELVSYNNYIVIGIDRVENEDGSVTITVKFDKLTK